MYMKGKDEAAALVAVLQNTAESSEARTQACEAVLALSKSDVTCVPLHRASHARVARSRTARSPQVRRTVQRRRHPRRRQRRQGHR